MGYLRKKGIDSFNFLLDACCAVVSRGMDEELARRESEREHDTFRWFTPEEAAVAEILASIIVPSDEDSPGIREVGVLGPPAIVALDTLIVGSSYRQDLYSRGLLSFDAWARKEHGCKFVELRKEDQIMLFGAAQQFYEHSTAPGSAINKAWRKLHSIMQARNGSLFAVALYPMIRSDCLQVFYTSRVSWIWLDYDGPPMDQGYSRLETSR
jgi:hypothetical protein